MKYVVQGKWIEIKKVLFPAMCVYCGIRTAIQLAHALFHKRDFRNKKMHKYTDVIYNACPCCDECQQFSETREGRQVAWKVLCKREGTTHMREWLDNFPAKIKEDYE